MSKTRGALRAALLATATAVPLSAIAQTGTTGSGGNTNDVVRVLLDQSTYWRSKSETKLADEALNRVLALDPNNVDALAQQAQAAADAGNTKLANEALAKLKALRPDDPRILSIQQTLRVGPIDQAALTDARQLAQQGKPNEALAAYRRVFQGDLPPPSLATEFYQTLGATEGNWEAAKDGLATHLRADPQDFQGQLAYAELLTYRDETRDEGINRLAFLTREPQVATQAVNAWRQALSWLPSTRSSLSKYEQFLAKFPDDKEVLRWRDVAQADSGTLRAQAFQDLQDNKLAAADAGFTKALAVKPDDSDSLIGLALVRFKQNRQADGRELIRKAIAIDPSKAQQYDSMLQPAPAGGGRYYAGQNGRRGNVDYGAAAGRRIRGEYAEVASLTQRGDYARAEALLRKLMGNRPNAGNYLQLADIQSRAGHLDEAASSYRSALRMQRSGAALGGLAGVLSRQGKTDEANATFAQAQAAGGGAAIGQNRAQALRTEAQSVSDPAARIGLYRAAVSADPANPWLRLELARTLLAQGQQAEARQTMAAVTDGPHPTVDQLRAGIYFAAAANENRTAAALVARLPANARTAEMQQIGLQAEAQGDINQALAQPSLAAMQQQSIALAAKPDPTGVRGAQLATNLAKAGDKPGARDVIRAALAATRTPTPQQRLAYAGALVGAGYPRDARLLTAGLQNDRLNPLQRSTLDTVQNGAAVAAADNLTANGDSAQALNELAPRLQQDPSNPGLNMALARIYERQRKPGQAVAITQELLRRNPDDMQVQVAAVSAALADGQLGRAGDLANKLTTDYPEEPQGWFAAAQVARLRNDNASALRDLRKAKELRARQLATQGNSDASDVLVPGWLPGRQYAANLPSGVMSDVAPAVAPDVVTRDYEAYAQYSDAEPSGLSNSLLLRPTGGASQPLPTPLQPSQPLSVPPIYAAPTADPVTLAPVPAAPLSRSPAVLARPSNFDTLRSTSAPTPDEPNPSLGVPSFATTRGFQPAADPLTADIDRSLQQVSSDIAPQVNGAVSLRGRSGDTGLGRLYDLEAPLEASYSPNGYGRLKVQVTPVELYTGPPSRPDLAIFGANPLPVSQGVPLANLNKSKTTSASGVGLGVSYAYNFVTADIGTTPLGFLQNSIVGGVQFLPRITNDINLRITADRRAVTDSLLSYAGQKDPYTGQKWGGVTRNRIYGQIEGAVFGDTYYYAGAGFAAFVGEQVAANRDIEAGAGFTTPVWSNATQEVRTGLNLSYFTFKRNLGNFTLGNGGYFSPQQFFSALIPVTYRNQLTPDLRFSLTGSIGGQTFRASSAKVFPTNDTLQAALQAQSADGVTRSYLPGFSGTGVAGGARGDIDYRVNDNFHIGAQAGFDRSGNFTEGTGLVYARYTFNSPVQ